MNIIGLARAAVVILATVVGFVPTAVFAESPLKVAGDWICTDICKEGYSGRLAKIGQDGNLLTFVNEWGGASTGAVESGSTIRAYDWGGLRGIVNPDQQTIHWGNGTVWKRK